MTKAKTTEFAQFDATSAADQVRAFAEKGVEQTQEAYAKMKAGAEDAQKMVEESVETVKGATKDVSLKTISASASAGGLTATVEAVRARSRTSRLWTVTADLLTKLT